MRVFKILPFLTLLLILLFASCRTQKQIITERVYVERSDSLQSKSKELERIINQLRDSVEVRDSVFVYVKGDTVRIDRWHTEYRDRWRTDTIVRLQADTVVDIQIQTVIERNEVETVKEINRLYWWQKGLIWVGAIVLICAIVFGAFKIRKRLFP